jgi:hypothetical protein
MPDTFVGNNNRVPLLYNADGNVILMQRCDPDGNAISQANLFGYDSHDGAFNRLRMDSSVSALQTISQVHHETHAKKLFHAYRSDTLATGDNIWIAITTPDSKKESHITWGLYCAGAIVLTITKGVTSFTGGTAQTPGNHNQRGVVPASVDTVKVGSDGVLTDGIAVTGGDIWDQVGVGSGNKSGAIVGERDEFIPAGNSITVYDILAVGNGIVCDLRVSWYEHTPHPAP